MANGLRRNVVFAVIEVCMGGLGLFVLYRIVVAQLGLPALGIWSLVLATTSLARLADVGTAAGLGRFVAISTSVPSTFTSLEYVETALLSTLAFYALISSLLYFPAYFGLSLAISGDSLGTARALLPFAFVSFTLMNVAQASTAALVGLQRSDQKSLITIAALVLQIAISLSMVRRFGLFGLAIGQIAQGCFAILAGWSLFLSQITGRRSVRLPTRWQYPVFKELIGFGSKLQLATIVSFLYEPATKFVMSSMGGLGALGIFEMSQRLVQQVRQIIVMPSQTLMPAFAKICAEDATQISPLYTRSFRITAAITIPIMLLLAVASPVICYVWLGRVDPLFVAFVAITSVGWSVNIVAAPSYLLAVASGRIAWNIYGSIVSSAGALIVGLLAGKAFGAIGVATASITCLAIGSVISWVFNCRDHSLPVFIDPQFLRLKANLIPGSLSADLASTSRSGSLIAPRTPVTIPENEERGTPPTIHIVTVTFRAALLLPATIESVQKHRRSNVTYWIVDGGSTDGTVDIIRKAPGVDHWISEPDRGIYDAMNKAVAMIPDGLILFLGAGDELLHLPSDKELTGADVYYGDVLMGERRFVSKLGIALRLYNSLHHQGLFIAKSVLGERPFDLRFPVYADFDLNQRLFKAKARFKRVPKVIARAKSGGVSDLTNPSGMSHVTRANFGLFFGALSFVRLFEKKKKLRGLIGVGRKTA